MLWIEDQLVSAIYLSEDCPGIFHTSISKKEPSPCYSRGTEFHLAVGLVVRGSENWPTDSHLDKVLSLLPWNQEMYKGDLN